MYSEYAERIAELDKQTKDIQKDYEIRISEYQTKRKDYNQKKKEVRMLCKNILF